MQGAKATSASVEDAESKVDAILDKVGLFRNFFIEECKDINNALAVTMPLDGGAIDRYILYDQTFFDKVSTTTGTDWGNVSILAHEVGHHLNGHTLSGNGSTHKVELQADEFSGFVLARMDCPLEDAQSAVSNLLPDEASTTHPAKQDRLAAIAKGWSRGSGKKIETKKIIKEVIENKVIVVNKDEVTAEMVLANYLEAIGGQEKILEVKSMFQKKKMKTSSTEFDNIQNILFETPQKFQIQTITNDKEASNMVFNNGLMYTNSVNKRGKKTWTDPIRIKTDDLAVSYFTEYSNLVNPKDVSYNGIETIKGIECHSVGLNNNTSGFEIEGKPVSSIISYINYYAIDTGLLFATRMTTTTTSSDKEFNEMVGNTTEMISYFTDYKDVSGILMPFKQKTNSKYGETEINIEFETLEIEFNPTIDPSIFETPKD